jgi:hypothetical protein
MSDAEREHAVEHWVLPGFFLAVAVFCLVLTGVAVSDGAWRTVPVHAGAALALLWVAAYCWGRSGLPASGREGRMGRLLLLVTLRAGVARGGHTESTRPRLAH